MQEATLDRRQPRIELSRTDTLEKVTGKIKYTTDMIEQEALYLRFVRSSLPHAIIKHVDVSQAVKIDGVERVLTAKDVPGANEVGFFIQDQPLFCDSKVRFVGDAIAMVVADSPEAAGLTGLWCFARLIVSDTHMPINNDC
ncbi:MAG: hypothetical protein ACHQ03_07135 [Candidatus Bathyarchaeia archaeon]